MKLLPVLACLVLLAGCLGYPAGSVRPGDAVTLTYTATDPATGQPLLPPGSTTAIAGQPSGLGPDVDRALVGRHANETFTVDAKAAASYTGTQTVPTDLGRSPIESKVARRAFEAQLGVPTVGQEFRASALYNATVVSFDGGNVTYRLKVAEGQEIPVPALGLKVVHHIEGADLVRSLAPIPGTTFGIDPAANGQTPLGLPPGSYRTQGLAGDQLVFDYSPVPAGLFGKAIHYEVKVVAVQTGSRGSAPSGEYGHRASPQLNGDPSAALGTLSPH
ncbi:MAG TPA: hypothetical protein VM241_06040 [Candidatus Thermoplasmatota archaeon]|nr:hypothetical protein [Candidatus Thermoplasmatota archaeon]